MSYCTGDESCGCDECNEANAEAAALEALYAQDMEIDEEEPVVGYSEAEPYVSPPQDDRIAWMAGRGVEIDEDGQVFDRRAQASVALRERDSLPPGRLDGYISQEAGRPSFVHFAPMDEVNKEKRNYAEWKNRYWQRKP